jgi:hypothetical protein
MDVTWSNVASSLERLRLQITDEQDLEPSYDPANTYVPVCAKIFLFVAARLNPYVLEQRRRARHNH